MIDCKAPRIRERRRGHQNGSVRQIGSKVKKWEGQFNDYVPDGAGGLKRVPRKKLIGLCSEMTKGEAREKLREYIRTFHNQPLAPSDSKPATLRVVAEEFFRLKLGDWPEETNTRKTMRSMFDCIILPALGDRVMKEITATDLKLFSNSLAERQTKTPTGRIKTGISKSYARWICGTVKKLFDLANEQGLIEKNPAHSTVLPFKTPKLAKKTNKSVFPLEEWDALLSQLNRRGRLLAWISMVGGTRPSEMFSVPGAAVRFLAMEGQQCAWMSIERSMTRRRKFKSTKTGKTRTIFLPPIVADELYAWMRDHSTGPEDLVFPNKYGTPLNRQNLLNRLLRPAAKRAGIKTLDVDWRMLRRSFATWANANEVDLKAIQDQLGHAKPDLTLGEYVQSVDTVRAQQITRLELILRGKQPMQMAAGARIQ